MNYRNLDMKLDQFVAYLNENKINLIPPFQRGDVWSLLTRRKLIQNVVQGRPIPAIFLYREASGEKYEYNILDGKQRLETLILFIGNQRGSLQINDIDKYFFEKRVREIANFKIDLDGEKKGLKDLADPVFREFQEYVIPTIEIALSEDQPSALDEMINLFVDINSYGVQVKRFDIVKAMSKDKLLRAAFNLIAQRETRGKDVLYKAKKNEFTSVLKTLQVVDSLRDANSKVDRMWELLVEIVLFMRTKKHRNPIEILKGFIRVMDAGHERISTKETSALRRLFRFFVRAYKNQDLRESRLVTNQVHLYTMLTSTIAADLLDQVPEDELIRKFSTFGQILDGQIQEPRAVRRELATYRDLSQRQTTHVARREERQRLFLGLISAA